MNQKPQPQVAQPAPAEGRRSVLLTGLGYYRLSVRRRQILSGVMAISLGLHIVAALVFGGWIIMRPHVEEVAQFNTPPPTRTYKPRELELKVKVQKRQRSSSRPSMAPRLVSAAKHAQVVLPDIKMDAKIIKTTFQPKFKAVSGRGLGVGLGGGYGTSGFGAGVSSINFFGIHTRGEKIAILVDASVSMVEEQKGGVAGYMRVKQRIEQVVDALSPASMFTVIVFADAAQQMTDKMVIANAENKNKAKLFVRPFNTEGNWGLSSGNVQGSQYGVPAVGGTTRLDLALTAAMQMAADTILLISDGLPIVKKGRTAAQAQAYQESARQWQAAHSAELAAYEASAAAFSAAEAAAPVTTEKIWVPGQPAQPAVPPTPPRPPSKRPPKEGEAPDMGSPGSPGRPATPATEGHWEVVSHRAGGGGGGPPPRPAPPPMPEPGNWTLADFVEHVRLMHEHFYQPKGLKLPTIDGIGYQIDKEGGEFLQKLSQAHRGQYRRVERLK